MCKTKSLFYEITNSQMPELAGMTVKDLIDQYPKLFNIEHGIELSMAKAGGYEFTDDSHKDFSDGSECKTASVSPNPMVPGRNSHYLEISNVLGRSGVMKSGDIRVVIYNPNPTSKKITYLLIPNEVLHEGTFVKRTKSGGSIQGSWNSKKDTLCPKLQKYEVASFSEVSKYSYKNIGGYPKRD